MRIATRLLNFAASAQQSTKHNCIRKKHQAHRTNEPIRAVSEATDAGMSFRIVSEDVMHKRYLTVYNQKVEVQRAGASEPLVLEYDIVGHPRCDFRFCVVRTFCSIRHKSARVKSCIEMICCCSVPRRCFPSTQLKAGSHHL